MAQKGKRAAGRGRVDCLPKVNVRGIALELMLEIMEEGRFCDKALHSALERYPLERRDRKFLTRLTEGTVERCIEMDEMIDRFSEIKVSKMKPVIRNILRLSVYQIFYMEQVPDSAACNEAVKLVEKRKLYRLKGFVNGVLRAVVREKESIVFPVPEDGIERYLSVRYSMPEWLVGYFLEQYGADVAEDAFAYFLQEKEGIPVRCMTGRFPVDEVRAVLEREQVSVSAGKLLSCALSIRDFSALPELTAFRQGMFQVQDESSMLVCQIAGIREGDTVLDVCAAPGGKALHAADMLQGSGRVVAADLTEEKTCLIRENARRLRVENIEVFLQDATVLREEWTGTADVLIADLPCSGLGVIGKKCDIKYKTKPGDITTLSELQRKILRVVSGYVKKGGRLVYSTCTVAKEENEDNVRWITENLPFLPVSIEEALPEALKNRTGESGYLQILPGQVGTDGFFLSCFEKR